MNDDKIISIATNLATKLAAKKSYFTVGIVAETIKAMRELGASLEDIAATLLHAASELKDNNPAGPH